MLNPSQLFPVFLAASRLHSFVDFYFLSIVDSFEGFSIVKSQLPITRLDMGRPLKQAMPLPFLYLFSKYFYVFQDRLVLLVSRPLSLNDIPRFYGNIPLILVLPL